MTDKNKPELTQEEESYLKTYKALQDFVYLAKRTIYAASKEQREASDAHAKIGDLAGARIHKARIQGLDLAAKLLGKELSSWQEEE